MQLVLVRHLVPVVATVFIAGAAAAATATATAPPSAPGTPVVHGYDQPQKNILDVLHAPSPPQPFVSPTRQAILLVS